MNKINFDEYANNYNDLLRDGTGFFTEDESYFARYKVSVAKKLVLTSPGRILEYGCGIGRNIAFLREAFPAAEIMGSDISAKSIELARRENPDVDFWIEGQGDERSGFDMIFVAGVFHHIPPNERPATARQLFERLNAGGAAVIFEHNPYNPITRRVVNDCPYDEGVELLSKRALNRLLEATGLRVVRHGYSLFFPPGLKALSGLEMMMSWLPLGGQYWTLATRA